MFYVHVKSLGLRKLEFMLIIWHGSLLIGYKILYKWSNEMRLVIHIIEYVNDIYTYMLLNVCQ